MKAVIHGCKFLKWFNLQHLRDHIYNLWFTRIFFRFPPGSISLPAVTPKSSTNTGTGRCLSVIFLQLLLLWLTISLPVISQAMRVLEPVQSQQSPQQPEEDQPVPGSSEEKTVSSISLSEEFLHEQESIAGHFSKTGLTFFIPCQEIYLAYHGELFSPPPDPAP